MNLSNARFSQAHYTRNHWHASVPDNVEFNEVLSPSYWTNNAVMLKIGDHVEVFCENGSYYAELIVRNCDRLSALMGVLVHVDFTESAVLDEIDPEFEIGFAGPSHMWRVVRKSDKEVVKFGFQSREEAAVWLPSYVKALAA